MRKSTRPFVPLFLLGLWAALPTHAAPLAPDRPGFSSGTSIVAQDRMQLEIGYQRDEGNLHSLPQTNLRYGIDPALEISLQWAGWQIDSARSRSGDSGIGTKYHLGSTSGFDLSLLGQIGLPTGNADPERHGVAPLGGLLWGYALDGTNALFGMLQASASRQPDWQSKLQSAIGYSRSHDDRLSSFVELYTDHPLNHAGGDSLTADGGVAWLFDDDIQLDASIGLALNRNAANFFSLGVARRF
ncbi:MAG: hypothetical protein COV51_02670 [Gallionellaceae bacterium CG11_big_fil_rev_8_21_14_0_20_60_62]|nr:MAG: hypothetical protein COV51_02670 [Gallionellaceae bacterium CG11_big_fil_rev_8_21_14_0_20_60_62]